MITVVNKKWLRPKAGLAPDTPVIYVGRPSPLGNPFRVGQDGTREEVIEKYSAWVGTTERSLKELMRIRDLAKKGDVALSCWCAPLPCHANVIKSVVEEWLRAKDGVRHG